MFRKIIVAILLLAFSVSMLDAQRSARWRRMRYEIIYGIGGTNFLGELGGADREGTNFVRDFEVLMSRPLIHFGIRYKLMEELALKSAITAGILRGDDKSTNEMFRNNRNLNFMAPIVELGAQLEYSIIREKIGHRYNLRRVRGVRGFKTNTYFFLGVSGFYFNPYGKHPVDGKWYALQPLGTEGQGLVPTRKKYSRIQVAIPYGIGFKYGLDRRWNLGLELGIRKTFTDYIDDVSTTYFNNETLAENDPNAAILADPSNGDHPNWTATNQQRGDAKDNDTYMFIIINLTYKLRTTRGGMPKF